MEQDLVSVRHERSQKDFPKFKFDADEYVEYNFSRAKSRLFMLWCGAGLAIVVILVAFLIALTGAKIDEMGKNFVLTLLLILTTIIIIAVLVATMVHRNNKLIITNKRAMQMIMKSPTATSTNVIDLVSVEDASFSQNSIHERFLGYGTLRLSTVGDETTYTFPYSNISAEELAGVIRLISEAKKNLKAKN